MKNKTQARVVHARDRDAYELGQEVRTSRAKRLFSAILISVSVCLFATLLLALGMAYLASHHTSLFDFSNIILLAGSAVLAALVVLAAT